MRFLLPRILIGAALLAAPSWAIDPAKDPAKGLNFFSEKDERAMGEKFARELDGKLRLIHDPAIQGQVERIGTRLAAQAPRQAAFRWSVVDTKEVNAFAVPGGFVYVNRGLIEAAESEDEVAGVLAHEIAHVIARHSTRQMSKKLLWMGIVGGAAVAASAKSQKWGEVAALAGGATMLLANLKYSRNDEYQSDALGQQMLVAAGYSPYGLVKFFEKIGGKQHTKGENWLALMSTHPPSADRIDRLRPSLPPADTVQLASTGEFGFLKAQLQGMPVPPRELDVKLSAAVAALGRTPAGGAAASQPAEGMPEDSQEIVMPGNTVWLNTRVMVQPGDEMIIAASGEIQPVKNSDLTCGPDGVPGMTKGWLKPISSAPTGALVVRVTGNGKPMLAGAMARLTAPLAGQIELGINDDNNFDNRGEFRVVLAVRRR